MSHGKSISIAYSMARKRKKASGGTVKSGDSEMDYSEGGRVLSNKSRQNFEKGVHESASDDMSKDKGASVAGVTLRGSHSEKNTPHTKEYLKDLSRSMHKNNLDELKAMPNPKLKAMGGDVACPSCGHMAEGGEANLPVADFESADFDVLDEMGDESSKADYTGSNSGDHLGNEEHNEELSDSKDIVSRVMKKRKK